MAAYEVPASLIASADQELSKAREAVEVAVGWLTDSRERFPALSRLDELAVLFQLLKAQDQMTSLVELGVALQLLADRRE